MPFALALCWRPQQENPSAQALITVPACAYPWFCFIPSDFDHILERKNNPTQNPAFPQVFPGQRYFSVVNSLMCILRCPILGPSQALAPPADNHAGALQPFGNNCGGRKRFSGRQRKSLCSFQGCVISMPAGPPASTSPSLPVARWAHCLPGNTPTWFSCPMASVGWGQCPGASRS